MSSETESATPIKIIFVLVRWSDNVFMYEVTGSRDSWLRLLARLGYFEPLRKGEQAPPIVR
jgi:hypothetical protein